MDITFDAVLKSSTEGELKELISLAVEERAQTPEYRYLTEWMKTDGADSAWVLVEALDIESGGHSFVLLLRTRKGLTLITNVVPEEEEGEPVVSEPGDIREFSLPASDRAASFFEKLSQLSIQPGIGGDLDVDDGTTHFLTAWAEGRHTQVALYGYSLMVFEDEPITPDREPDQSRYRVVEEAYDLWASLLTDKPEPRKVVPTGIPDDRDDARSQ